MTHAILIIAHKYPEMLIPLVEYFKQDCAVYIHYDRNTLLTEKEATRLCSFPQVKGLYQQFAVHWGGYSVLQTELFLLQQAYNDGIADYYHILSGQDYPIKSFRSFMDFFETHPVMDFMEYKAYPVAQWESSFFDRFRYTYFYDMTDGRSPQGKEFMGKVVQLQARYGVVQEPPPNFPVIYKGSQWMSLSSASVCFLLTYTRTSPQFCHWIERAFAPEESYIQTVLVNLKGETAVNANLRFILWTGENGNNPSNLSLQHWEQILKSNALFARKMEPPYCTELIKMIDETILYAS